MRHNGSELLTPSRSGRAPIVRLDLTMLGTQSLVFHAPLSCEPQTCPTRRAVADRPFSRATPSICHKVGIFNRNAEELG